MKENKDSQPAKCFVDLAIKILLPEGGFEGLSSTVYNMIKGRINEVAFALEDARKKWLEAASEKAITAMAKHSVEGVCWSHDLYEAITSDDCEE